MRRSLCATVAAFLLIAPLLPAQKKEKRYDPPRPRLDASQDPNSAAAYQRLGMERLARSPHEAAAAFHWAHRVDPSLAEAFYAERIARHLSDIRQLSGYIYRNRSVLKRKEVLEIDSLQIEALIRNPMLNPWLDRVLFELWFEKVTGSIERVDWDRSDPGNSAWIALSNGQFEKAANSYAKAIKQDKKAYGYHLDRALALYLSTQMDSSVAAIQAYIEARNTDEKKEVVFVYQSKALAEFTLGWVYDRMGRQDQAKEAYGRALAEDLSFAMAHVALAEMAQAANDTATSLQEFDLAVQLRGDDPLMRLRYGNALVAAGRHEDATMQFERAVELEPHFALPWYALAQASDRTGRKPRAIEAYQGFVERAPAGLKQQLGHAAERLKALKAGGS